MSAIKHAAFQAMDELLQHHIDEVIPDDRKLVFVHTQNTVQQCLQVLRDHNVLSLPVVDHNDGANNKWLGIISYIGLIRFLGSMGSNCDKFLNTLMRDVMKFSKSSPLQIESRTRLISAVEFFTSTGRLHRCGVVKSDNTKNMCSQSDIARFVSKHFFDNEQLQTFARVTMNELGWGQHQPESVRFDATLLDAINLIIQRKVSCLAVVDESQTLMANFSASDLRGLGSDIIDNLNITVINFLTQHSPSSLSPQTEAPTQSLGVLLARLSQQHLHHVWLEDTNGKAEGLVTLTDIMNLLLNFIPVTENIQA